METPMAAFAVAPDAPIVDVPTANPYPRQDLRTESRGICVEHELDADQEEELLTHCRINGAIRALIFAWVAEFVLVAAALGWLLSKW